MNYSSEDLYRVSNANYINSVMERLKALKPQEGPSALQEFGIDLNQDKYDAYTRLKDSGLSDDEITMYRNLYQSAIEGGNSGNFALAKDSLNLIPENVFKELHNESVFNAITEPRRKAQQAEEDEQALQNISYVEPIDEDDRNLFKIEGRDEFGYFDKTSPKAWWNGLKLLANNILDSLDWTDDDSGFVSKSLSTVLQSGLRGGLSAGNGIAGAVLGGAQTLISSPGQTAANMAALGIKFSPYTAIAKDALDVASFFGLADESTKDQVDNVTGEAYRAGESAAQGLDKLLSPVTRWIHPLESATSDGNLVEERVERTQRMQVLADAMGLTDKDMAIITKYGKEKNAGYSVYSQDVAEWISNPKNKEKLDLLDTFYREAKRIGEINDALSMYAINPTGLDTHIPKVCKDVFMEKWNQGEYIDAVKEGLWTEIDYWDSLFSGDLAKNIQGLMTDAGYSVGLIGGSIAWRKIPAIGEISTAAVTERLATWAGKYYPRFGKFLSKYPRLLDEHLHAYSIYQLIRNQGVENYYENVAAGDPSGLVWTDHIAGSVAGTLAAAADIAGDEFVFSGLGLARSAATRLLSTAGSRELVRNVILNTAVNGATNNSILSAIARSGGYNLLNKLSNSPMINLIGKLLSKEIKPVLGEYAAAMTEQVLNDLAAHGIVTDQVLVNAVLSATSVIGMQYLGSKYSPSGLFLNAASADYYRQVTSKSYLNKYLDSRGINTYDGSAPINNIKQQFSTFGTDEQVAQSRSRQNLIDNAYNSAIGPVNSRAKEVARQIVKDFTDREEQVPSGIESAVYRYVTKRDALEREHNRAKNHITNEEYLDRKNALDSRLQTQIYGAHYSKDTLNKDLEEELPATGKPVTNQDWFNLATAADIENHQGIIAAKNSLDIPESFANQRLELAKAEKQLIAEYRKDPENKEIQEELTNVQQEIAQLESRYYNTKTYDAVKDFIDQNYAQLDRISPTVNTDYSAKNLGENRPNAVQRDWRKRKNIRDFAKDHGITGSRFSPGFINALKEDVEGTDTAKSNRANEILEDLKSEVFEQLDSAIAERAAIVNGNPNPANIYLRDIFDLHPSNWRSDENARIELLTKPTREALANELVELRGLRDYYEGLFNSINPYTNTEVADEDPTDVPPPGDLRPPETTVSTPAESPVVNPIDTTPTTSIPDSEGKTPEEEASSIPDGGAPDVSETAEEEKEAEEKTTPESSDEELRNEIRARVAYAVRNIRDVDPEYYKGYVNRTTQNIFERLKSGKLTQEKYNKYWAVPPADYVAPADTTIENTAENATPDFIASEEMDDTGIENTEDILGDAFESIGREDTDTGIKANSPEVARAAKAKSNNNTVADKWNKAITYMNDCTLQSVRALDNLIKTVQGGDLNNPATIHSIKALYIDLIKKLFNQFVNGKRLSNKALSKSTLHQYADKLKRAKGLARILLRGLNLVQTNSKDNVYDYVVKLTKQEHLARQIQEIFDKQKDENLFSRLYANLDLTVPHNAVEVNTHNTFLRMANLLCDFADYEYAITHNKEAVFDSTKRLSEQERAELSNCNGKVYNDFDSIINTPDILAPINTTTTTTSVVNNTNTSTPVVSTATSLINPTVPARPSTAPADVTSIPSIPTKESPFSKLRIYSGGALGADSIWSSIAESFGVPKGQITHYIVDSSRPQGSNEVQKTEQQSGQNQDVTDSLYGDILRKVSTNPALQGNVFSGGRTWQNVIGTTPIPQEYYQKLHRRNYLQVENANAVYAVAPFDSNDPTHVEGGTDTAVTFAKALGKPIFVLDPVSYGWFTWDAKQNKFVSAGNVKIPTSGSVALIGSRRITSRYDKGAIVGASWNEAEVRKKMIDAFVVDKVTAEQATPEKENDAVIPDDGNTPSFRGRRAFLSNFYESEIVYNGHKYTSVEAAFQAQKEPGKEELFENLSPEKAKALGKKVKLRSDWNEVKDGIMKALLLEKFSIPSLKAELLKIPDEEIQERNTWGDTYWGIVNGEGQNKLGKLLTEVRNELLGAAPSRAAELASSVVKVDDLEEFTDDYVGDSNYRYAGRFYHDMGNIQEIKSNTTLASTVVAQKLGDIINDYGSKAASYVIDQDVIKNTLNTIKERVPEKFQSAFESIQNAVTIANQALLSDFDTKMAFYSPRGKTYVRSTPDHYANIADNSIIGEDSPIDGSKETWKHYNCIPVNAPPYTLLRTYGNALDNKAMFLDMPTLLDPRQSITNTGYTGLTARGILSFYGTLINNYYIPVNVFTSTKEQISGTKGFSAAMATDWVRVPREVANAFWGELLQKAPYNEAFYAILNLHNAINGERNKQGEITPVMDAGYEELDFTQTLEIPASVTQNLLEGLVENTSSVLDLDTDYEKPAEEELVATSDTEDSGNGTAISSTATMDNGATTMQELTAMQMAFTCARSLLAKPERIDAVISGIKKFKKAKHTSENGNTRSSTYAEAIQSYVTTLAEKINMQKESIGTVTKFFYHTFAPVNLYDKKEDYQEIIQNNLNLVTQYESLISITKSKKLLTNFNNFKDKLDSIIADSGQTSYKNMANNQGSRGGLTSMLKLASEPIIKILRNSFESKSYEMAANLVEYFTQNYLYEMPGTNNELSWNSPIIKSLCIGKDDSEVDEVVNYIKGHNNSGDIKRLANSFSTYSNFSHNLGDVMAKVLKYESTPEFRALNLTNSMKDAVRAMLGMMGTQMLIDSSYLIAEQVSVKTSPEDKEVTKMVVRGRGRNEIGYFKDLQTGKAVPMHKSLDPIRNALSSTLTLKIADITGGHYPDNTVKTDPAKVECDFVNANTPTSKDMITRNAKLPFVIHKYYTDFIEEFLKTKYKNVYLRTAINNILKNNGDFTEMFSEKSPLFRGKLGEFSKLIGLRSINHLDGATSNAVAINNTKILRTFTSIINTRNSFQATKGDLAEEYHNEENTLYWTTYKAGNNIRFTLKGTDINPQSDKEMTRQIVYRYNSDRNVKLSDHWHVDKYDITGRDIFAFGVMQNLGLKPEKKFNINNWWKSSKMMKGTRILAKYGKLSKAVDSFYNKATLWNKCIEELEKEGFELEHTFGIINIMHTMEQFNNVDLDALVVNTEDKEVSDEVAEKFWQTLEAAIPDGYVNYMHVEADGVTNGPAIGVLITLGLHKYFSGLKFSKAFMVQNPSAMNEGEPANLVNNYTISTPNVDGTDFLESIGISKKSTMSDLKTGENQVKDLYETIKSSLDLETLLNTTFLEHPEESVISGTQTTLKFFITSCFDVTPEEIDEKVKAFTFTSYDDDAYSSYNNMDSLISNTDTGYLIKFHKMLGDKQLYEKLPIALKSDAAINKLEGVIEKRVQDLIGELIPRDWVKGPATQGAYGAMIKTITRGLLDHPIGGLFTLFFKRINAEDVREDPKKVRKLFDNFLQAIANPDYTRRGNLPVLSGGEIGTGTFTNRVAFIHSYTTPSGQAVTTEVTPTSDYTNQVISDRRTYFHNPDSKVKIWDFWGNLEEITKDFMVTDLDFVSNTVVVQADGKEQRVPLAGEELEKARAHNQAIFKKIIASFFSYAQKLNLDKRAVTTYKATKKDIDNFNKITKFVEPYIEKFNEGKQGKELITENTLIDYFLNQMRARAEGPKKEKFSEDLNAVIKAIKDLDKKYLMQHSLNNISYICQVKKQKAPDWMPIDKESLSAETLGQSVFLNELRKLVGEDVLNGIYTLALAKDKEGNYIYNFFDKFKFIPDNSTVIAYQLDKQGFATSNPAEWQRIVDKNTEWTPEMLQLAYLNSTFKENFNTFNTSDHIPSLINIAKTYRNIREGFKEQNWRDGLLKSRKLNPGDSPITFGNQSTRPVDAAAEAARLYIYDLSNPWKDSLFAERKAPALYRESNVYVQCPNEVYLADGKYIPGTREEDGEQVKVVRNADIVLVNSLNRNNRNYVNELRASNVPVLNFSDYAIFYKGKYYLTNTQEGKDIYNLVTENKDGKLWNPTVDTVVAPLDWLKDFQNQDIRHRLILMYIKNPTNFARALCEAFKGPDRQSKLQRNTKVKKFRKYFTPNNMLNMLDFSYVDNAQAEDMFGKSKYQAPAKEVTFADGYDNGRGFTAENISQLSSNILPIFRASLGKSVYDSMMVPMGNNRAMTHLCIAPMEVLAMSANEVQNIVLNKDTINFDYQNQINALKAENNVFQERLEYAEKHNNAQTAYLCKRRIKKNLASIKEYQENLNRVASDTDFRKGGNAIFKSLFTDKQLPMADGEGISTIDRVPQWDPSNPIRSVDDKGRTYTTSGRISNTNSIGIKATVNQIQCTDGFIAKVTAMLANIMTGTEPLNIHDAIELLATIDIFINATNQNRAFINIIANDGLNNTIKNTKLKYNSIFENWSRYYQMVDYLAHLDPEVFWQNVSDPHVCIDYLAEIANKTKLLDTHTANSIGLLYNESTGEYENMWNDEEFYRRVWFKDSKKHKVNKSWDELTEQEQEEFKQQVDKKTQENLNEVSSRLYYGLQVFNKAYKTGLREASKEAIRGMFSTSKLTRTTRPFTFQEGLFCKAFQYAVGNALNDYASFAYQQGLKTDESYNLTWADEFEGIFHGAAEINNATKDLAATDAYNQMVENFITTFKYAYNPYSVVSDKYDIRSEDGEFMKEIMRAFKKESKMMSRMLALSQKSDEELKKYYHMGPEEIAELRSTRPDGGLIPTTDDPNRYTMLQALFQDDAMLDEIFHYMINTIAEVEKSHKEAMQDFQTGDYNVFQYNAGISSSSKDLMVKPYGLPSTDWSVESLYGYASLTDHYDEVSNALIALEQVDPTVHVNPKKLPRITWNLGRGETAYGRFPELEPKEKRIIIENLLEDLPNSIDKFDLPDIQGAEDLQMFYEDRRGKLKLYGKSREVTTEGLLADIITGKSYQTIPFNTLLYLNENIQAALPTFEKAGLINDKNRDAVNQLNEKIIKFTEQSKQVRESLRNRLPPEKGGQGYTRYNSPETNSETVLINALNDAVEGRNLNNAAIQQIQLETKEDVLSVYDSLESSADVVTDTGAATVTGMSPEFTATLRERMEKMADALTGIKVLIVNNARAGLGATREKVVAITRGIGDAARAGIPMSTRETYAHENGHIIFKLADRYSPEFKTLRKTWTRAREYFADNLQALVQHTWTETELGSQALADQANQQELEKAQRIYDYLFGTSETNTAADDLIEEFAVMAYTNEFIGNALSKIPAEVKKSNIVNDIHDTLVNSKSLLNDLLNVIVDAVTNLYKKIFDKFTGQKVKVTPTLMDTVEAVFDAALESEDRYNDVPMKNLIGKLSTTLDSTDKAITDVIDNTDPDKIQPAKNLFNNLMDRLRRKGRFAQEMVDEITNAYYTNSGKRVIAAFINKMSALNRTRQQHAAIDAKYLTEAFGTELTKEMAKAVRDGIVVLDLQSLKPSMSNDEIMQMLTTGNGLSAAITNRQQAIVNNPVLSSAPVGFNNFIINAANNLACKLANDAWSNEVTLHNAAQIVLGYATEHANWCIGLDQNQINALVQQVDQYVSLKAMEYYRANTEKASELETLQEMYTVQTRAAGVRSGDKSTGFDAVLNYHQETVETSKRYIRDTMLRTANKASATDIENLVNVRKGYIKSQFNPYKEAVLVPLGEEYDDLKHKGYLEYTGPETQSLAYLGANEGKGHSGLHLMYNDYPITNRHTSGAMATITHHVMGAELTSPEAVDVQGEKVNTLLGQMFQTILPVNPDKTKSIELGFNDSGEVKGLRFVDSLEMREKLLEEDTNFATALSKTAASIEEKHSSTMANLELIDVLINIMNTEYDPGNASDWVMLRPIDDPLHPPLKGSDAETIAKDYATIPQNIRKELYTRLRGNPLLIKKEHYNLIFGFHNMSLRNLVVQDTPSGTAAETRIRLLLEKMLYKTLANKYGLAAQAMWEYAVHLAKDVIVNKSLVVSLNNIKSNIQVLCMAGLSPIEAIAQTIKGYQYYTDYNIKIKELRKLHRQLSLDTKLSQKERSKLISDYRVIRSDLENNPIRQFMQLGGATSIVAGEFNVNLDQEPSPLRGVLRFLEDKPTAAHLKKAKPILDIIFMRHGSPWYDACQELATGTDTVAKWIYFTYLRKNTYPVVKDQEQDSENISNAFLDAQEMFINYDLPTNKYMQAANDLGFVWFSKFLLRAQRPIYKLFRNNPARALTYLAIWQCFNPPLIDGAILPSTIFNLGAAMYRVKDPISSVMNASGELPLFKLASKIMPE